jgi:hypothetical protein
MDEEHWTWSRAPFGVLTLESGRELCMASAAGREEGGLNIALGGIGGGAGKD